VTALISGELAGVVEDVEDPPEHPAKRIKKHTLQKFFIIKSKMIVVDSHA
jgi:hypothetical protein